MNDSTPNATKITMSRSWPTGDTFITIVIGAVTITIGCLQLLLNYYRSRNAHDEDEQDDLRRNEDGGLPRRNRGF
ncbi:Nn.00g011230.m01.CDS01 [Neocucurbitaria sp. VM-36]